MVSSSEISLLRWSGHSELWLTFLLFSNSVEVVCFNWILIFHLFSHIWKSLCETKLGQCMEFGPKTSRKLKGKENTHFKCEDTIFWGVLDQPIFAGFHFHLVCLFAQQFAIQIVKKKRSWLLRVTWDLGHLRVGNQSSSEKQTSTSASTLFFKLTNILN